MVNVLLLSFGLLEIFDFPPIFYIFDAHSIWHGLTPIITYILYNFLIKEAQYYTGLNKIV